MIRNAVLFLMVGAASLFFSCSSDADQSEEQISVSSVQTLEDEGDPRDTINSISPNFSKIASVPNRIILTGMPQHRLVSVYKVKYAPPPSRTDSYSMYGSDYYDRNDSEFYPQFMPGIDLVYGYNLLNVAHFDLTTEKLTYLFDHPVLIKSLYYPSFEQDSIDNKPINRDYYLVSAYDKDTNADTLINRRDLRHLFYFNATVSDRIEITPADYSVERSQYDWKNDLMYIFAIHDSNNNGRVEKKEPLHVFWIDLKKPAKAKRLY